jgi:hypothetical protein
MPTAFEDNGRNLDASYGEDHPHSRRASRQEPRHWEAVLEVGHRHCRPACHRDYPCSSALTDPCLRACWPDHQDFP